MFQETVFYTRGMIQACQDVLQEWFESISCIESTNVSFGALLQLSASKILCIELFFALELLYKRVMGNKFPKPYPYLTFKVTLN